MDTKQLELDLSGTGMTSAEQSIAQMKSFLHSLASSTFASIHLLPDWERDMEFVISVRRDKNHPHYSPAVTASLAFSPLIVGSNGEDLSI